MWRYLRLFIYFVRFSMSRALEFRLDFFFRIFMDIIFYAVNIVFYKIIFLHTSVLAGWSEPQMMIFVSGYLIVDSIQMTLFSNNFYILPMLINKGDLDYYLVRPVSSLFFVSLRDFAANSFINLLMTMGILAWSIVHYPGPFSWLRTLGFLFFICIGSTVFYSLRFLSIILSFWTHSPRGHDSLFWPMTRVMERPDRIFHGWFRLVFCTILPFSLMASYPARLVLDPFDIKIFLHLLSISFGLFIFAVWFWNKGLRIYSSASS